jgi:hypothetical protein
VVIYADDLIYFPDRADADPVKDLSKVKWGLIVNESKSRWIKRDGVWLVDSFKFLGIRYYPSKIPRVKWSETLTVLTFAILLDLALGQAVITIIALFWEITQLWQDSKERFVADTRNGANLEFTGRESFISWLAVARELLLNSEYLTKKWSSRSLSEWLDYNWKAWQKLKNPLRLLFMEPFKNTEVEKLLEHYVRTIRRKDLLPGELEKYQRKIEEANQKLWIKNPLTGYFLSRMQANSWEISQDQNFKLNAIAGSWCAEEWKSYCRNWILPIQRLNVFVASTFASHDLLEWLADYKQRDIKPTIRRVKINSRQRTWSEVVIHKVLNERDLTAKDMIF